MSRIKLAVWVGLATSYFVIVSATSLSHLNWVPVSRCPSADTECKKITDCPIFYSKLTQHNSPGRIKFLNFLNTVNCGYFGKLPKVCCPKDCRTMKGKKGSCVDEEDCPAIRHFIQKYPYYRDILFKSECKGKSVCCPQQLRSDGEGRACVAKSLPDPRRECCGYDTGVDKSLPDPRRECCGYDTGVDKSLPDPRRECCGYDTGVDKRISNGTVAKVDQYTWLVLIEYNQPSKSGLRCGGSLISGRYVLTAAHCTDKEFSGEIKHVVVGEYDTRNDGPDCGEVSGGGEDCTQGEERIQVAQIFIHKDYSTSELPFKNDIALLRLAEIVSFSDFIGPICLPSADASADASERLLVMGWGAVDDTGAKSNVKLVAQVPYLDLETCSSMYKKMNFTEKHICAGGAGGRSHCGGDSGGPLVRYSGGRFEIAGVISFGTVACGSSYPGVNTNVKHYLDWIMTTMDYYN